MKNNCVYIVQEKINLLFKLTKVNTENRRSQYIAPFLVIVN